MGKFLLACLAILIILVCIASLDATGITILNSIRGIEFNLVHFFMSL